MTDSGNQFSSEFSNSDDIYWLSHSVGRAPTTTDAYVRQHFLLPWQSEPETVWPAWTAAVNEFRSALARLFNGSAANFCPQANVSSAATKILYSLPELRQRPTILLSEEAFPSLSYVFQQGAAVGFRLKYIEKPEDAQDIEVWREKMSADVGLVLITHVHSNTGKRMPTKEIVQLARNNGAVSIVDTAQSNGVVPIDVQDWSSDFLIGSCVKWLCGGPGAGFLWANPAIVDRTEPKDVGWFSHADPFEFDIHKFRFAPDALRFWGGTPSVMPYVVATNSINTLVDIGIDTIQEHNVRLTERLINSIDREMLVCPRDPKRRGGTIILDLGKREEQVKHRFDECCIRYDQREEGVRLSPHIYNTDEEVSSLVECLT